ncbi:amyloid fiber anchoring/assembly protein TapA [Halobacillus hunanensis]|uniref:amyloid fiber anchoring/assembly protein TapA n=1 Tax=Halobacillus hunanensis TaxID=578214 RepID=UPI0009A73F2E|nr:amyloid fiber anchoring/assembly protein TapA [Halobacillus hunanensis]
MRKKRTKTHLKSYKHKCSLLLVTVTIMSAPLTGQSLLSVPTNAAFNDIESVNFSIQADIEQDQGWDKSSLEFIEGKEGADKSLLYAIVKNGGDSKAMERTTTYEVYFVERGNPKKGEKVAEGIIPILDQGETFRITFSATKPGNYMFKAYQSKGHPGKGELWSESIEFIVPNLSEQEVEKEPVQEEKQKSTIENMKDQESTPPKKNEQTNKEQEADSEPAQKQKKEEAEEKQSQPEPESEKTQKKKTESPQSSPSNSKVKTKDENDEPQPKSAQTADTKEKVKKESQSPESEQKKQEKSDQTSTEEK